MEDKSETEASLDWKQRNKEHWNSTADYVFEADWLRKLHGQIVAFLRENLDWLGLAETPGKKPDARVLDYACGNGILSVALAPYASQLRGMDISSNMVRRYNEAATKNGLSPEKMHAVEGDVLMPTKEAVSVTDRDFFGFRLILVSLALHHMAHPEATIEALSQRLAPGGALLIIDWEARPGSPRSRKYHQNTATMTEVAGARTTIVHAGFTKERMLSMLSAPASGLVDARVRLLPELSDMPDEVGGQEQLFFALARKPKD